MARYTGPTTKIARKFKEPIFGPSRALDKKPYPPGQHGQSKKRSKQSEYAVQLAEKQKAKYTYGLLERQFENLFHKAARKKGITGENLLRYLEARLDNTVFRLGIAPSRAAARQLVTHKHITVNGEVVNIPSYSLRPGDKISVREKSKTMEAISDALGRKGRHFPWLDWDTNDKTGTFIDYPLRDQIPENIKEHLIVELYSK
jgi:small subunit ribosomal protein S4